MKKLIFIASVGLLFSCNSDSNTVKIGEQVWMTNNLDVITFRNGDPILEAAKAAEWRKARDNKQPAWCYYNNDPVNGQKYGKLYNWYAVNDSRGLAPVGYRVPTDAEMHTWYAIEENYDIFGLKNEADFSWLPGGNRTNDGAFYNNGDFNVDGIGFWWSSTEKDTLSAWYRRLDYLFGDVDRLNASKGSGFSVRCIKD